MTTAVGRHDSVQRVTRAWLVWSVGVFAYIVAVLQRTSFGVSGLAAADRFDVAPSVLSGFVVLQVVVYAGMQIPAGVLLDRYGSRIMIATGALILAAGQITMAMTGSLPLAIGARVLVGIGDAFTFISVLRLVPRWFPERRVPVVSQLTGIVGQLGQVLSALPFAGLLAAAGWQSAYLSAGSLALLACVLAIAVVRNAPPGVEIAVAGGGFAQVGRQLGTVWRTHGTRLGFFSHMGTQFSITIFALMWGVPYLVSAQGLTSSQAGGVLTVSVISAIVAGPVLGLLSGRFPLRRSWLVLGIMASNATAWTVVLALSEPAPLWLLVVLVVVISVGGPGSMIGFDYARATSPGSSMGTAQGMVNIGGFLATLLVIEGMGLVLDRMGGYTFEAFRVAWLLLYPVWVIAAIGVLVTRGKARRQLAEEQGVYVRPLREVYRRMRGD